MKSQKKRELNTLVTSDRNKKREPEDVFSERIPIDALRGIWNDEDEQYTDNELYQIRDMLYTLCNVALHTAGQNFENKQQITNTSRKISLQQSKTIPIIPNSHRKAG